jgi:signal transduction histidine kinase
MRGLAELGIAGWSLGLTLAAAAVGDRVREARRRAALNRNLHELRRPLQALVLAPASSRRAPVPAAAELALAALDDLDREINGSARPLALRPVACRALVESAVERWRGRAAEARRSLELRWRAGAAMAMADPCRVAQALDNLLANAIEHGGLRVWVETTIGPRGMRISVSNTARRVRQALPRGPHQASARVSRSQSRAQAVPMLYPGGRSVGRSAGTPPPPVNSPRAQRVLLLLRWPKKKNLPGRRLCGPCQAAG